jgi:hypothetical protein
VLCRPGPAPHPQALVVLPRTTGPLRTSRFDTLAYGRPRAVRLGVAPWTQTGVQPFGQERSVRVAARPSRIALSGSIMMHLSPLYPPLRAHFHTVARLLSHPSAGRFDQEQQQRLTTFRGEPLFLFDQPISLLCQLEPNTGRQVIEVRLRVRREAVAIEHIAHRYIVAAVHEKETHLHFSAEAEVPLRATSSDIQ